MEFVDTKYIKTTKHRRYILYTYFILSTEADSRGSFKRMSGILKIFSENLKLFYRFRFFLKTFSIKFRLF
jgi:hypothetical protein